MTGAGFTSTVEGNAGYWPSAWPGEDGGPQRRQAPSGPVAGTGLGLAQGSSLVVRAEREVLGTNMVVQRDVGELFLQGASMGEGTAFVERIDPETLTTLARSPELPAGPWWPGGMAVHADGSLYVTQGRWCHRLDPDCTVAAGRELPRDRPYNSLVVLADGTLVMKDFVADGAEGSELVALAPGTLEVVDRLVLPEGSIARLSADGTDVYVVGDHSLFRVRASGGELALDEAFTRRYRTIAGQTYGWDVVLDAGAGWFLDNGAGTESFGGCFHGKTGSQAPLHLVRVPLVPTDAPAELVEVCGEPGGIVANPPLVDPERGVAVGYDSGHGVMAAWTIEPDGSLTPRWQRTQDHAGHMLRWPGTGEVLTYDYDRTAGCEQVVVLDVATGEELGRAATSSPVQSVLFPCPGWDRDAYAVTFTTVSRLAAG